MSRIASLLPGATEILCALGAGDRIVGISHECDHPPEIAGRPRLTTSDLAEDLAPGEIDAAVRLAALAERPLIAVDAAALAAARPDLIVTQGLCRACGVSPESLASSVHLFPRGIPEGARVVSLGGRDFAGVLRDVERLGEAIGAAGEGRALATSMRERWERVPAAPKPSRVAVLEWPQPPFCAGHWVPEMVARAGGVDVLGAPGEKSRTVTWEAIAAAEPDVLIVAACGYDLFRNAALAWSLRRHPESRHLPAVRDGRVWACDANAFVTRPGPRLVRGAEIFAGILGAPVDILRHEAVNVR